MCILNSDNTIKLATGLEIGMKVINLLRDKLNDEVWIGCFTNCREQGYTFYNPLGESTYCVYEHRNSDEIIINGREGRICSNGELPYNGDSKWDYLYAFNCEDFEGAATKLAELLNARG